MSKIIVIGGGAAGMMAAIMAAKKKHNVILLEKNEKLGRKIYITGKGRCNITNASEMEVIFQNIITNAKFLYSSLYSFTNQDVIQFFHENGCQTKVERGNRVFPVSDHSSDVILTLEQCMRKLGVEIRLNTEVTEIGTKSDQFSHVTLKNGTKLIADSCIVATGGLSYPSTGSTGDGYRFAKEIGHTVTALYPSLVSIHVQEDWISKLAGLSLKNIEVKVIISNLKNNEMKNKKMKIGKVLYTAFGEMLFTHSGVSGPVILSASSLLLPYMKDCDLEIHLDLKPALSNEQLDARIIRDFEEFKNKQFKNSLEHLLPQKLIGIIIALSNIPEDKQVNAITREERMNLIHLLKNLTFKISRLGGFNEAVITKGGIDVKEIDPTTMESKLVKGLYFVGEVLDLDALTGGYNLQIAWSTGAAAGTYVG